MPLLLLLVPAPGALGVEERPGVVGTTCALAAQGPADGSVRSGVVSAGPWVSITPGATVVSVTCSVQFGSDDPAAQDAARVVGPGSLLAPTAVTYYASASATAFVCTEVVVHWPPQEPTVEPYDADPQRPGPQCQRAQHQQNSVVVVDFQPSNPAGWWCVRVDHGLPPYGYQVQCNPLNG